jgi:hypothetical protein
MTKPWLQTGLILLAVLLPLVSAQAQDLPYASFELQQFPAVDWEVPGEKAVALFPDYDATLLVAASYYEQPARGGLNEGVLTIETTRECLLSLIYYSPAGTSYLVRTSLPVLGRSSLSSTFVLPAEDASGLTRLMLWEAGFEESWLAFLARHPQQDIEPVPGMLAQAWFGRQQPVNTRYPWEDIYRPATGLRTGSLRSSEPLAMARLDSSGRVASKDCSIGSSAPVRLVSDEYGILGMWELDWSSRLKLVLELPPGGQPEAAYLIVYGSSGQPFGVASNPAFEISVNGWSVAPSLKISPFEVSLQPVMLDVSQYLEEGKNEISLQLSALADNIWKVSRIELWTE